ncbi:MAG: carbohydrate ABC transporter permease [Defluviitaleaceae bacterium]|nr:carbohydrate ABC transporter permease [Defluviitaleaceae bacterium]
MPKSIPDGAEKKLKIRKKNGLAPYLRSGVAGKTFDVFNIVFMVVFMFLMIYPFWNQFIISINQGLDTQRGGLYFWPRVFTLENYRFVFSSSNLMRGAVISVARVVVGTATHVVASGLLAYVTTVKNFSGRRLVRVMFIASMYFAGGLIPFYMLIINLGLLNTFAMYWLPSLFGAFNMLLIASYIYGLPDSLTESARIDGAGEFRIFFQIIAPLCLPVLAVVSIMTAVGHWNSWFDVIVFNPSGQWDTLQVHLRRILLEREAASQLLLDQQQQEAMRNLTTASVRAATTMIVTLPILFVYPFFQKYFVGGITLGAVKG